MKVGEREVRSSGPLRLLEVECHSCGGKATLSDPSCRECVFGSLSQEEVEGVVLLRPYHRLYPFLSPFLRELRSLRLLLSDRTRMGKGEGRCRGCVEERKRLLRASLSSFLRDLRPPELQVRGRGKECEECNSSRFLPLLREVKRRCRLLLSLREECLREVPRPFFADCSILPFEGKGEVVDSYSLRGERGRVRIYLREDSPLPFYELDLPEFRLPEGLVELLERAFFSEPPEGSGEGWGREALMELGGGKYPAEELEELAQLLSRWTSYGILEALSRDEHLTDFLLPSPPELQPARVIHERWDLCETGIRCSTPALLHLAERLASRVGTSFDEVRPELDVEVEELGLRIFLARDPALWKGVGMAVRKRRERTWTQPLFLQRKTLTPLASAFLSWAVREGASAFLIGEVGSAKTSLLESLLPEVGREHHLICFQDTPELHVEELVRCGYSVENVRVGRPEELERQIEAFLRGGPAHWFIAEVRSQEAVRAALGAAARRGSQPVVSSFHARSRREMYELICHILGLPSAVYKHVDLVVGTARFSGREGTVRRVVELSEVKKGWREEPEYSELFSYLRREDLLLPSSLLEGERRILRRLSSFRLEEEEIGKAVGSLRFLPPEKGGSGLIPFLCRRSGREEEEALEEILWEALMKAKLLELSGGDPSLLELPAVSRAYERYSSLVRRKGVGRASFREWLRGLKGGRG
jgi:type IV secretory pathway ATPase VirB11/archaellum biosynthesis ATPase